MSSIDDLTEEDNKHYDDTITKLHLEMYVNYSNVYDTEIVHYNIENVMNAACRMQNIPNDDYKLVGFVWKWATIAYLNQLIDNCAELTRRKKTIALVEFDADKANEFVRTYFKNMKRISDDI